MYFQKKKKKKWNFVETLFFFQIISHRSIWISCEFQFTSQWSENFSFPFLPLCVFDFSILFPFFAFDFDFVFFLFHCLFTFASTFPTAANVKSELILQRTLFGKNGTVRLSEIRGRTSALIDSQGPCPARGKKVGETTCSSPLLIIRLWAIVIEGDRVQGSSPKKRTTTYFLKSAPISLVPTEKLFTSLPHHFPLQMKSFKQQSSNIDVSRIFISNRYSFFFKYFFEYSSKTEELYGTFFFDKLSVC